MDEDALPSWAKSKRPPDPFRKVRNFLQKFRIHVMTITIGPVKRGGIREVVHNL